MDNSNSDTFTAADLLDILHKGPTDFMDCAGDFKQNGTGDKQSQDRYFMERPTNGKRHADEFDADDDDFGPETDVDVADDMRLSPLTKFLRESFGNNNPDDDKLMDFNMDLRKQQKKGLEEVKEYREDTPTPPVDSVLDSSGVADNVAESGDDSEDEWNYYRVDPKKENSQPIETILKVSEQEHPDLNAEEMSQLNPDAAEFVPVSPTRNVASPTYNRDLLEDKLLAQSPRRALPMDINVPSPVEFQSEVKQRPSEVFEEYENQNGHQMSSQELMQNFLNGKDINEIEFHPSGYVKSVDDIPNDNYICDNTNLKTNDDLIMSGVVETVASPVESQKTQESKDEHDFCPSFIPVKDQDPMSMSFYQDKDEEGTEFSTNPFDLNKVQMLPQDDVEDELTDSELKSEEKPLENNVVQEERESPVHKDLHEEDVHETEKVKSPEVVPEVDASESPFEDRKEASDVQSPISDICELPKSPNPVTESPVPEISKSPMLDVLTKEVEEISKSPILDAHMPVTETCEMSKSPALDAKLSKSPALETQSHSEVCESPALETQPHIEVCESPALEIQPHIEVCESPAKMVESPIDKLSEIPKSPVLAQSPFDDVCELPKSPAPVTESPLDNVCQLPKSPAPVTESPLDNVCQLPKSPALLTHSPLDNVCEIPISPARVTESPLDNVCELPKSPALLTHSPLDNVCDISKSPAPEAHSPTNEVESSLQLDVHSPSVELSSPVGPLSPKSPIPELTDLVSPDITVSIKDENIEDTKSPAFSQHSTATPVDNVLKSPEIECDVMIHHHPDLSHSPLVGETITNEDVSISPEITKEPESFVEKVANMASEFISESSHLSEVIEKTTDIISEIKKDVESKIEEVVSEISKETLHFDDELTKKVDSFEDEVMKEPIITLENVVKEVERDTANFIGDACKFAGENVNYLSETVNKEINFLTDVKGDAENVLGDVKKELYEDIAEEINLIETEVKKVETKPEEELKIVDSVSPFEENVHKVVDSVCEATRNIVEDLCNIAKDAETKLISAEYVVNELSHISKEAEKPMESSSGDEVGDSQKPENVAEEKCEAVEEVKQEVEKEVAHLQEAPIDKDLIECPNITEVSNTITEIKSTFDNFIDELKTREEALDANRDEINLGEGTDLLTEPSKEAIEVVKDESRETFVSAKEDVEEKVKSPEPEELAKVEFSESVTMILENNILPEVKESITNLLPTESLPDIKSTVVKEIVSKTEDVSEVEQQIAKPEVSPLLIPTEELTADQAIEIKRETISPEYPVPTLTSPTEETKELETPPTTPAVITTEVESKSPEPQKIVEAVEKLSEDIPVDKPIEAATDVKIVEKEAVVEKEVSVEKEVVATAAAGVVAATAAAGVVAATAAAVAATKTAKPKATIAAKKPLPSKASPTSPTKPTPPSKTTAAKKATPATKSAMRVSSAPTAKSASAHTKPISSPTVPAKTPVSSPKPPVRTTPKTKPPTPATKTTAEKKPLANGDIKPLPKTTLQPKKTSSAKPAEKLSPTTAKPPVSKTNLTRPTTAPTKATARPPSAGAATKPRPSTLTKSTPSTTVTKTTTAPRTTSAVKSASTTTTTKLKTTPTAPKPKSNLTATKPKAADTEKQIKETANKQLSASKTTTKPTSTATKTTVARKLDAKMPGAKTTTTRTTTTKTAVGKKTEITAVTKTKSVSPKVPVKQNGVIDVIQEITTVTVVSNEPELIKDNSPIDAPMVIDNSQLLDSAVIAE